MFFRESNQSFLADLGDAVRLEGSGGGQARQFRTPCRKVVKSRV
jgi:hypothetical protein